jgi:mannose-6-phosphate isomerase
MPIDDAPFRFVPFLRPMVWGGRRLGESLGKKLETGERYGESWELSDHPLHRSVVAEGPFAGQTLHDLMTRDPEGLLGSGAQSTSTFPWLVKFLDAEDWLSVQVHPGEEAIRRLWPGEGSKTEAWFVIDARPGSRIYAGLVPGVDENKFGAALTGGNVIECLHSFEPKAGDSVFLPAGTVHAVGGGVLMAEVQQTSDATFRLFDWNRRDAQGKSRTLHIEEGLASIDWSQGPVHPLHARGFADHADESRQILARCPYFILEYFQTGQPVACGGEGMLQVLIPLNGSALMEHPAGEKPFARGRVWLLPAAMPRRMCRPTPTLGALLCTLPR